MTTNPFVNALLASLYIVLVVTVISIVGEPDTPDTFLTPIVALSLLVLSVATMGFLFFFRPMQMYLDGQKQEAVTFFFKTLGTFAVITALVAIVSLLF